jgi:chromosome segregation protein
VRIRQIDLVGFKSFREPTRLTLLPGINAIVGPNGCGKSNVADAIRWALGEQSVKHLRAREMEDVIFSGTEASAQLNLAEVTLTFEQASGESLNLEGENEGIARQIARLAEFTVTRRIFRSGESQYLINQTPARLRDVTELFLGSGVGPKAYAMIEQGRVSQIVQAKPEELRLFLEEAAGTTRFRSRKIACERKLERTQENLARVNDVVREIDRQLAALRRQARRAEEYRRLQEELRAAELGLFGHRFARLDEEYGRATQELQEIRSTLHGLQSALRAQEERREGAAREDREAKTRIEKAFDAIREVGSSVVRAGERQTATQESLASLVARRDRLQGDSQALSQRRADMDAAVGCAEAARAAAVGALQGAEEEQRASEAAHDEAARVFEQAQRRYDEQSALLNEERGVLAAAEARREEAGNRLAELERDRDRAAERLSERVREVSGASIRLEAGSAELDRARAHHGRLEESRRQASENLRLREEAVRRVEDELASLRERIVHVRGRLQGLEELEAGYADYAEGLAGIMGSPDRPAALLAEVLDIPAELEPAVAAALGELLRGAVVESPRHGAALARRLREAGEGRVSLVPLGGRVTAAASAGLPRGTRSLAPLIGTRSGYEALRDVLFGDVALAEDLDTALAAWAAFGDGVLWVTRDGDVLDRRGVVTGGEAPEAANLLERRRVIVELTDSLVQHERSRTMLEKRLEEARHERADVSEALESLDGEAHAATLELVAAEHACGAAQRERAAAEARVVEAQSELETARAALERGAQIRREAEGAEREAMRLIEERRDLLTEHSGELNRRRARFEEWQGRRELTRTAVSRAREELTEAVSSWSRLEHEHQGIVAQLESGALEVSQIEGDVERARLALAGLEREVEASRAALAVLESDLESARAHARAAEVEVARCEEHLVGARRSYDDHRERSASLEAKVASLDAQRSGLARQCLEQHGMAVADLPAGDELAEDEATERIAGLRERLEQIGDVNLAAIADARELEERQAFLQGQRADLESAMEQLRETIAELSRTTRTRFRETFERANEKFAEVFSELFHGGAAQLVLTNPSSLLETGVTMEVRPPGKRVGSLELLSGGERALTAVSLIMALFQLRATPFCVLDEVDAPLDDTNAGRFNSLLERMSASTQFIVITHKRRTMESADALYGVTMAEAGVSQLVSVRMGAAGGDRAALAATA